jgi:mycothiol synthase
MREQTQYALEDLIIRPPTMDDARRTHELMVRCDVAEYGEPDMDLSDLTFDWGRIELARDAWLAWTPSGDVVGYGAVLPWGAALGYDLYIDPAWEGQDLGQALLARCEVRGQAIAQKRGAEVVARMYIPHVNRRNRETVERAGLTFVKYRFEMRIRLDEPPPAPRWPDGVSLRTAVAGQDERAIHQLVETAFAHPGRTPTTFEEWQGLMQHADLFEADLWFLAVAEPEIVGACLAFAYPPLGWVRQLAVDEGWRRKGIGTALLHHAFGVFLKRGYDRAGLTVDSDNPSAYLFYQRIGMRRMRQYDEYERRIGG